MITNINNNILNIQNYILGSYLWNDYPLIGQLGFQDPASNWMYAIIDLHDRIVFYLIIILAIVVWTLISALMNSNHLSFLHHGNLIELIWTLTPAAILWAIGLPSLRLLYIMDEVLDSEITIKAIGNQWYWSYEYSDYLNNTGSAELSFDSFMVDESTLQIGNLRNLSVDNPLILPVGVSTRLIVTSSDVIHSFAIPSLALKVDAIPGRLNATGFIINRPSSYYGQCSELCGVLHGFMPICIEAVSIPKYLSWIESIFSLVKI